MIKDIVKKFSVYSLVSFLGGIISFVMLPILTKYLSPEDYGMLSIVNSLILFFSIIISFGSLNVLMVKVANNQQQEFMDAFKSFVILTLALAFFFSLSIWIWGWISDSIFGVPIAFALFIPLIALCLTYYDLFLNYFNHRKQALDYAKLALSKMGIEISLTLVFVVLLGLGWIGRIGGLWAGLFLVVLIPVYLFYRNGYFAGKLNLRTTKELLGSGSSMILYSVAVIVMNLSDRLFLEHMVGLEETGFYSIGYTIGSLELILGAALIAVFRPDLYRFSKDKKQLLPYFKKAGGIYLLILLSGLMFIALSKGLVFRWLIDPEFAESVLYVNWIALGFLFWSIFNFAVSYFIALNRGKIILLFSMCGILINTIANYVLIHHFGTIGAAYATTATYFLMASMCLWLFKKDMT